MSSSDFPKRCGCCGAVYSEAAWERLPVLGYQRFKDPEAPPLEMRNCSKCDSTLAIELDCSCPKGK